MGWRRHPAAGIGISFAEKQLKGENDENDQTSNHRPGLRGAFGRLRQRRVGRCDKNDDGRVEEREGDVFILDADNI